MKIKKKGDWLSAKVGDELVMMSAERGNYIGLSEVGARIWDLLETDNDIDAICAQLQQEYEVTPEVCRAEVESFCNELVKQGAIAIDPPPAA
ncbi:MAG: PqqD family peptide modification chaperone [Pseudolabrys sp.]|nr:PqqD family peptide modification chaperone [Pseudolabrys sp.]